MNKITLLLMFAACIGAQNPYGTAPFSSRLPTDADLAPMSANCATTLTASVNGSTLSLPVASSACFLSYQLVVLGSTPPYETAQICSKPDSTHLTLCSGTRGLNGTTAASHASGQLVSGSLSGLHINALSAWLQAVTTALGANLANVVKNPDPAKSGYTIWQGMTNGSVGFGVADASADGTLYIMPSANSTGSYLKDNGSATCPTLPSGVTPASCHQLAFGTPAGGGGGGSSSKYAASISGTSTSITAATHGLGTTVVVSGCKDGSGAALWPDWSVDGSGNVTVTSAVSQAGTCYIFGQSIYAAAISGTSTSITAATHGLGSGAIVSGCKDGSNNSLTPDWSVDGSGNVTITSAVSQTGTCYLR